MNDYTSKALESWYKPDNPLYHDPRHPLIKLAGEAGELLDLYGKHEYKPGFDWWNCEHCGYGDASHSIAGKKCILQKGKVWTPLVLDELGDWFYYLRIVAWQQGVTLIRDEDWPEDMLYLLTSLSYYSSGLLAIWVYDQIVTRSYLVTCYNILLGILSHLDCTLDHLTDLNYRKLNSDANQHGWSEAR